MTGEVCAYCGHGPTVHNPALGDAGGLFQPGTRPCTAIVVLEIPGTGDPALVSAATRTGWWPCSCEDFTTKPDGGDDDDPE